MFCIYFSSLRLTCRSGKKKKSENDECVLARGEWVVCICQRCYYSRQRSYRPISRTIITIISSRSPYNSSQLSTSHPWQHKHVLTQRAPHFTVSHYKKNKKNIWLFHSRFLKDQFTRMAKIDSHILRYSCRYYSVPKVLRCMSVFGFSAISFVRGAFK